jgi:hypothetical protein
MVIAADMESAGDGHARGDVLKPESLSANGDRQQRHDLM